MNKTLQTAIDRLDDVLKNDDGQAWKEAERFKANPPKNYRTPISNLVAAIQAAAIAGFALRCVAAGSMWATFELTDEEATAFDRKNIFIEEDK